MTRDAILQEIRKLPREDQVELIDALVCLVGTEPADVALTPAQARDLDRRIAEYEAGKAKIIPGDQAIAELRKRL
jgi:putative addiction module component (TIGR02574 family)